MEIIHFQDPLKLQQSIEDYLMRSEAENNLIFGILANIIAGEYENHQKYMSAVKITGITRAVVLCTAPWPALISYENPPPERDVLRGIMQDLQHTLRDEFTGLSGNIEFVRPLVTEWEKMTGKEAILKMSMQIYKLESVRPVDAVPGRIRSADKRERPLLETWYAGFHQDIQESEPAPDHVQEQIDNYLTADPQNRGLKIWEVDGQPVSMAGYSGPTPNGIRIGAVYTPPALRRNGYASALVAGVSQTLLDRGYQFCFLFADLLNPTSNHIYQDIGYQPVCTAERYLMI